MEQPGPLAVLRRVLGKGEIRALSRRYFVANSFDGVLTSIGIIIGGYLSGIHEPTTLIAIGLGAAVGLGISGIWSVWEIERAETSRIQAELEQAMLTSLEDTRLERNQRYTQLVLAISAGAGPVIAIVVTLIPFFFVDPGLTITQGVLLSIGCGIALLGSIGAYMGFISKQRWYVAAVRMALAGIVVAIISIFLPG